MTPRERSLTTPRSSATPAAELEVVSWLNVEHLTLAQLRGQVILVEAFQMLCPGCVSYGLPLARTVHDTFQSGVAVIGLHTVFEHHDVMSPAALRAFASEYALRFPIGIDRHEPGQDHPVTFTRYGMRGTPTTLLIDRAGRLRMHTFGALDHLVLGGGGRQRCRRHKRFTGRHMSGRWGMRYLTTASRMSEEGVAHHRPSVGALFITNANNRWL